jgi:hypothetical protein
LPLPFGSTIFCVIISAWGLAVIFPLTLLNWFINVW